MTKCLFLMGDCPISPNSNGGAAVLYSHLELLAKHGFQIDLVVLSTDQHTVFNRYRNDQQDEWNTVNGWCSGYHLVKDERSSGKSAPVKNFLFWLNDPISYFCPTGLTTTNIQKVISQEKPDLIWAEHLVPALLAGQSAKSIPIIYSHHDWEWRIGWYRGRASKRGHINSAVHTLKMKRVEEAIVKRVAGCVSGSASEVAQIKGLGVKKVAYFPITYNKADLVNSMEPQDPVRIVHLGGMKTTANRVGLQRFLDVSWTFICKKLPIPPELWVVGSLDGAPESLLLSLKQAGAICTGFVNDLSSVLRPYDIHIIPWEHDTGTRTRIPLVLNYSQVVVSTKTTATCLPELKNDANCILVNDLYSMGEEILLLLSDQDRRKRIGKVGRQTFIERFTREAIQPRFDDFLNTI